MPLISMGVFTNKRTSPSMFAIRAEGRQDAAGETRAAE